MEANIVRNSLLFMQVCVPKEWTDEQVVDFANSANPSGLDDGGWQIIEEGSDMLGGYPERVQCGEYEENCHIMLDC